MENSGKTCELCTAAGGVVLWASPDCRVVRVADAHYPGFCRVIWSGHVREMTDLSPDQRHALMDVVFAVEAVVRSHFKPHKINLASFGNMVPHLHWHVIPRWPDDRHFPEPIWGAIRREGVASLPEVDNIALMRSLEQLLGAAKMDGIRDEY